MEDKVLIALLGENKVTVKTKIRNTRIVDVEIAGETLKLLKSYFRI